MTKLGMKKGFTLIELMIVVAIIGILAAIAIPQFAQLISKSQEGATKGNLGTLRSALSIYYGDTEGRYPEDGGVFLTSLTNAAKYLQNIPVANLPRTTNSVGHGTAVATVVKGTLPAAVDAGGWYYDNVAADGSWGNIIVSCSHNDLRSVGWSTY